ncbi:hypothetical protein R1flu_026967 [Riccia fluitans]|uniref:Uncharacterized protein n=1 Tax=Riccia fluitans TaxID=41844 RepID=A0ABD1XHE9_9MARC
MTTRLAYAVLRIITITMFMHMDTVVTAADSDGLNWTLGAGTADDSELWEFSVQLRAILFFKTVLIFAVLFCIMGVVCMGCACSLEGIQMCWRRRQWRFQLEHDEMLTAMSSAPFRDVGGPEALGLKYV